MKFSLNASIFFAPHSIYCLYMFIKYLDGDEIREKIKFD